MLASVMALMKLLPLSATWVELAVALLIVSDSPLTRLPTTRLLAKLSLPSYTLLPVKVSARVVMVASLAPAL